MELKCKNFLIFMAPITGLLCDNKCCIFLEDKYLVYRRVYISHVV